MPSSSPKRFHKTLGFRLTFWYSSIFILSSLTLSIVSFAFVFSTMRDNRKAIQLKVAEYRSLADKDGVQAIAKIISEQQKPSRRTTFFVRVIAPGNKTVLLSNPRLWEEFDFMRFDDRQAEKQWQYFPSQRDTGLLEVTSARLANDYVLQVGKSIQDREDILERFRDTLLATMIPMILIGLAGGAFLAFHALRPIRGLIHATRSIVETGRMDLRVPESNNQDELDELVRLFNSMLERIEGLIKGMRDALDNVAHDLRTPMTRLRGTAEMCLEAPSKTEQYEESLATCVEESDRILTLLNSIMDVSEAETGTMRLKLETVNLTKLIREMVELYQDVAEDNDIVVSMDRAEDIYITADLNRMRQVVANLLDNAIKYNRPGGRVVISVRLAGDRTVMSFRDTGIGIPADEIPDIWDRLYRGDKSRSQPGLGLGLSLVKAIVRAHTGHVEVHSEPGVGSVFTVRLPVV
ncbi:MAG: HAMP domain-containing protein [Deltaproteobacteria bacterium]|nr:HAMP domain-containing protein [Deltaproteobacteria bacterium]